MERHGFLAKKRLSRDSCLFLDVGGRYKFVMRFIAFDLETTGIVAGVDRVVEIGAVRFIDGQVEGVFSTLVDPQIPMPPGASRVNGITDDMLHGKPRIDELLEPFAEFCESD